MNLSILSRLCLIIASDSNLMIMQMTVSLMTVCNDSLNVISLNLIILSDWLHLMTVIQINVSDDDYIQ